MLNSVFLHECVQGRPRLGDRARREDPADVADPRRAARGRARPGLRPPARGLRPAADDCSSSSRASTPADAKASRAAGAGRAAAGRAAPAPHHRRRDATASRPTSTRRWPAAGPPLDDHQRRPAGRHEGRRRAVRLRRDAAAVRAAVRRGDEDRGRLPRAAHGEDRRRRQGHASCSPRSRATCTTSARTSSTSSCPTTATTVVNLGIKQPISAILDAAEEHDADVIGMSGLLVKSTVVMKENLEELNQRGRRRALAGDARRRRADPGVRRAGPRPAVRRARCATPATRSRACA